MTREEHLEWAKKRALQYCDQGDVEQALASIISDLRKHDELADHLGITLGVALMMSGGFGNCEEMKKFIEGFN